MPKCEEALPGNSLPTVPICKLTLDTESNPIICAVFLGMPCFLGKEGVIIEEERVVVSRGGREKIQFRQIPMLE